MKNEKATKTTAKAKAPKTYKTLRALLLAKERLALPKGIKVGFANGEGGSTIIAWEAKGVRLFAMPLVAYAAVMAKRDGFAVML